MRTWIATLILLVVFGYGLWTLGDQSLWYDEAWTAFAVRNPDPVTFELPRGTRAQITTPLHSALKDARLTIERVRGDVHPPLYFLMIDIWVLLIGDSEFALRYPSLLFGLLTAALMVPLGGIFVGKATYPPLLLGTSLLFVVYTREARMYTLLIALTAAGTLAYWRLLNAPCWRRVVLYSALITLGLYTHYAYALILMVHGLYTFGLALNRSARGRELVYVVGAMSSSVMLFGVWIPIAWAQLTANPVGPLAVPVATSWAAVTALLLLLTAGGWWLSGGLIAVWITTLRQQRGGLLIGMWLLLPPLILFAINANGFAVYQVRYVLLILPAFALALASGLTVVERLPYGDWLARAALLTVVITQMAYVDQLWQHKPDYRGVFTAAAEIRLPDEPILTDFAHRDPAHYYRTRTNLIDGIALDLAWRSHSSSEIDQITDTVTDASSVWVAMPANVAKTWAIVRALIDQGRVVGYREHVENMLIYRFDLRDDTARIELPLTFTLIDDQDMLIATYTGRIAEKQTSTAGDELCLDALFELEPDAPPSHLALTLVQDYNTLIAQTDLTLDVDRACLLIPADTPVGAYTLRLTAYRSANGQRYPVMHDHIWWGYSLFAVQVTITP